MTMYLGNHPSRFSDKENCKFTSINALLLKTDVQWDVCNCEGRCSIQTITDNKNNHGWDQMVHAAGRSKSRAGIDTILYIYSTLHGKE